MIKHKSCYNFANTEPNFWRHVSKNWLNSLFQLNVFRFCIFISEKEIFSKNRNFYEKSFFWIPEAVLNEHTLNQLPYMEHTYSIAVREFLNWTNQLVSLSHVTIMYTLGRSINHVTFIHDYKLTSQSQFFYTVYFFFLQQNMFGKCTVMHTDVVSLG